MSANESTPRINSSLRQSFAGQTVRLVGKLVDLQSSHSNGAAVFEDNIEQFPVVVSSSSVEDWQEGKYYEIIGAVQSGDFVVRAHDAYLIGDSFSKYSYEFFDGFIFVYFLLM